MTVTAPPNPTPTTVTAEAARPGVAATGIEDFDDLPAEDDNLATSHTDGNAVESDDDYPDAHDFESLLAAAVPQVAPAPTDATPVVGASDAVEQQPAALAPPGQPQPAVAPAAAPVAPQPQAAPAQPAPGVTPAQPSAAPGSQDPAMVLANLQTEVTKNRDTLVKAVAQHYEATITDEDIDLLQTEPKKALAVMAGRVHTDGLANISSVLSQNLTTMVYGLMEAQRVQQTETDAFYQANSHFDRKTHGPVINQIAATLRQVNPTMDAATFKTMLAATAAAHLKLTPGAPPAQPQARQPAAPQRRAPRGFQPAGSGQAANPPAAAARNPWDAMVEAAQRE